VYGDVDHLANRATELEKQAVEQLVLMEVTAYSDLRRLHSQLAESLSFEASMVRQQQNAIRGSIEPIPHQAPAIEDEWRFRSRLRPHSRAIKRVVPTFADSLNIKRFALSRSIAAGM
jgi:hypothetical protein